jgi:tetraprenyl-beta-curcumene synthase
VSHRRSPWKSRRHTHTAPPSQRASIQPECEPKQSRTVSIFGDRRLLIRAGLALILANVRYWPTVAPLVSAQLNRYEQHARRIRDPTLRVLALDKLHDQAFHAQVATTLATLAPRAHRKAAVQAIVALEVMYDYLDGLTEKPVPNPLRSGDHLYQAFIDSFHIHQKPVGNYYAIYPHSDDGGYLETLVTHAQEALAQLPAINAIADTSERCIARFAEAQIRAHAVNQLGDTQFEEWATRQAAHTTLGWLEYFAGATSSVLGLHALIAAAGDPHTTLQDAAHIDTIYLYIGVIVTMLDSLIDYERDIKSTGKQGYTRYYTDPRLVAQQLTHAARQAALHAHDTPNGAHHVMTLAGVTAFYTSAPTATSDFARPVTTHIRQELRPLITPTLAVMRAWRLAKRLRRRLPGKPSTTTQRPA